MREGRSLRALKTLLEQPSVDLSDVCSVLGLSRDGDVRSVVLLTREDYLTVDECIERVVLTDTYACTWVMLRATLADDDVTSLSVLTTEELYSESLTF
jgi:hypothetical protein